MQRTRSIKWGLVALLLILALGVCAACTRGGNIPQSNPITDGTTAYNTGTRVIEGYIVGYDRNNITVDEVEFLTANDTTRIKELGLDTTKDFRDGYYIMNDGTRDRVTLPLATNVQVRFSETTYGVDSTLNGVRNSVGTGATVDGAGLGSSLSSTMDGMGTGTAVRDGVGTGTAVRDGVGTGATGTGLGATGAGTVTHIGHTLGGVVGGVLGGVEMMTNRFARGMDASGQTPYFITIENGYVTNIEEVGAYSNFAGTNRTVTDGVGVTR